MSASVPKLVATATALNQTAGINATTLHTPASDSTLRASVYVDFPDPTFSANFTVLIKFTDDINNKGLSLSNTGAPIATLATGGGLTFPGAIVGCVPFRAKSGNAITYEVSGTLPSSYNFYIVLEEL